MGVNQNTQVLEELTDDEKVLLRKILNDVSEKREVRQSY